MASEKAGTNSQQSGEKTVDSIVLEEEIDPNYIPTDSEVVEYAKWLGMDLQNDRDLFWIAREGLMAPLPKNWKPCKTKDTEDIYYFNFATGDSTWDHPCDGYYKRLYEEEKKKKEVLKKESNDVVRSKAKMDVEQLLGKVEKKKKSKAQLSSSSLDSTSPTKGGAAIGLVGSSLEKKVLPGISRMAPLGGGSSHSGTLGNRLSPTSTPIASIEPTTSTTLRSSSSRDEGVRSSTSSSEKPTAQKIDDEESSSRLSTTNMDIDSKPTSSGAIVSSSAVSKISSSDHYHNADDKDVDRACDRAVRRRYDDDNEEDAVVETRNSKNNSNSSNSSSNLRERLRELEDNLETSNRKCDLLLDKVGEAEGRFTKERDLVTNLRSECDKVEATLNRQLKDLRGQILKHQRQEDELFAENKEYRAQIKDFKRAALNASPTSGGDDSRDAIKALRDKLADAEQRLQDSQEKLEALRATTSKDIATYEASISTLKSQLATSSDSMEELRFQEGVLRREKERLIDELAAEVASRDRLHHRLQEFYEDRSSAAAEKAGMDGGEFAERIAMERRIEALESDLGDKNKELRSLRARTEELGLANEAMARQREELEKKCTGIETMLSTSKAELAKDDRKIAGAGADTVQRSSVDSDILKLTSQLTEQEKEVLRVNNELAAREKILLERQEEITRLEGLLTDEKEKAEIAVNIKGGETLLLEKELTAVKASQEKLLDRVSKLQEERLALEGDAKMWEDRGVSASMEAARLKSSLDNERGERLRLSLELEDAETLRRAAETSAQRARENSAAAARAVPLQAASLEPRASDSVLMMQQQGAAYGSIVELSIFVGRQQATMQRLEEQLQAAQTKISRIENGDKENASPSAANIASRDSTSLEALAALLKDMVRPPAAVASPAPPTSEPSSRGETSSHVASVASVKIRWRNKVIKERQFVDDASALIRKKKNSLKLIQDHLIRYKESFASMRRGENKEAMKEAMAAINNQAVSLNTAIKQMKSTQAWLHDRVRSIDAFEALYIALPMDSSHATDDRSDVRRVMEKLDRLSSDLDSDLTTFSKDSINNDLSSAIFFTPDATHASSGAGSRRALSSKTTHRSPVASTSGSMRHTKSSMPDNSHPPLPSSTATFSGRVGSASEQLLQSESCERHAMWLSSLRQEIGRFAHVAGGGMAQRYARHSGSSVTALNVHLLPPTELFDA